MKKKLYVFMMMLGFIIVMLGVKGEGGGKSVSYAAQDTRTGVYQAKYTANGKTTTEWCYLKNGAVQYNYNGFQSNSNGWWYIEKGKVTFKKTDVIQGTVKGQNGWWYVKDSKVQFVNSVEQNSNGWWVIRNGKVDFNYTGFADNSNGWWYIEKGKVTFKKTDIIQGTVKGQNGWWFVKGSRVKFVNSVEQNSNGWWAIRNGKVDFNYTGFADNSNGWWYAEKGKITFKKTDVIQGTVKGQSGWWYVKGSKVQFVDSVEKNSNGWWFVKKGMVDFSFTGIAKNSSGWWYCKKGKVVFDYTGDVKCDKGGTVTVKGGKVTGNDGQGNIATLMSSSKYISGKEFSGYTYEITPMVYPFNDYFFIKTDNPDPDSFYFVDKSTKYSDEEGSIAATTERFADVKYEDAETGRVKGGYIARGSYTDGGTLYIAERKVVREIGCYNLSTGEWENEKEYETKVTNKTVKVKAVKDSVDYIIDTYTKDKSGFFNKMDAAQAGLYSICLYSGAYVLGELHKSEEVPYYGISTSPHNDQNFYIQEPYYRSDSRYMLMSSLYPYRLDSIGFPSMMVSVAQRMQPSATYKWDEYYHYDVSITYKGKTQTYGGAGHGGGQGINEDQIIYRFLFDKSKNDASTKTDLDTVRQRLCEYGALDVDEDEGKTMTPLKWSDVKKQVGEGSYARVVLMDSMFFGASGTGYTYLYDNGSGYDGSDGFVSIGCMSNVWFDGRYFNVREYYYPGATFEDTVENVQPGLVFKDYTLKLPNDGKEYYTYMGSYEYEGQTYYYGLTPVSESGYNAKTGKWKGYTTFTYDESSKSWRNYELENIIYYDKNNNPVKLTNSKYLDGCTITMDEAKAMKLDKNTNKDPSSFLIYDRVTKPGTKGSN